MARPLWTGALNFGLVNVPVKLFPAVRPKEVHFHQLHKKDGARIKQKRICATEDKEVPYEEIAKGYETSAGHYVMFDREELEKLSPKATKTIEIEDFVELKDIDPIFYESTYFLVPDKGAQKPYALLHSAMEETGKVGIARMVMRTKQYLCAVRPLGHALAISTMQYSDEVLSAEDLEDLPRGSAKPKDKELAMAKQLVESLAAKFEPSKYKDDYREEVLELIHKKEEGEEIVAPEPEQRTTRVVNLMDALRKSLEQKTDDAPAKRGERRHVAQAARTARARVRPRKKAASKRRSTHT
jgi:DNA end-binding protein Ku